MPPPKGSTQRGTPSGRFFGDFLIWEKVTRGGGAERPPHGEECRGWGAAPPRIVQYRPGAQPQKKRTAPNRPVWAVEGGFTPRFHFNIYRSCPLTRGTCPHTDPVRSGGLLTGAFKKELPAAGSHLCPASLSGDFPSLLFLYQRIFADSIFKSLPHSKINCKLILPAR